MYLQVDSRQRTFHAKVMLHREYRKNDRCRMQKVLKIAGVLRCLGGKLIGFQLRQCSVVNTHIINQSAVGIS